MNASQWKLTAGENNLNHFHGNYQLQRQSCAYITCNHSSQINSNNRQKKKQTNQQERTLYIIFQEKIKALNS